MILGQLRMWACQTINAPLLRIALIRAGRAQRPPNFKMVIECSNMLSPPSLRFRALARKLQKCCFFENQFWAHRLTLSRYNLETETWEPKPYTCSESLVCKDSVATSPKKFSLKILGMERFTKTFTFSQISVQQRGKKVSKPTFRIAQLNQIPQSFQG